MAQARRRLGAEQATMVEMRDRILAVEAPFAGAQPRCAFEAEAITVYVDATATRAGRAADGTVTLRLETGPSSWPNEILAATDRHPTTDDLGSRRWGRTGGDHRDLDLHLAGAIDQAAFSARSAPFRLGRILRAWRGGIGPFAGEYGHSSPRPPSAMPTRFRSGMT